MVYKIAIKNGVLFAAGSGEDVTFQQGYDSVETLNSQAAFDARLAELRAA